MTLTTHPGPKGLLDGDPALRQAVVEGILALRHLRPEVREEGGVRTRIRRVPQELVAFRHFLEILDLTGNTEGRAVDLTSRTVYSPCPDPVLHVADRLFDKKNVHV